MNIIKINNVKRITSTTHGLEIKSNERFNDKNSIIVILDEDDIQNENRSIKLRGYYIDVLILPKKYKYAFFETPIGKIIKPNLFNEYTITYY